MNKYLEEADDFAQILGTSLRKTSIRLIEKGYSSYVAKLETNETVRLCDFYFTMVSMIDIDFEFILEIGTGSGRATKLLASLFPDSIICTFDVPKGDPDFKKYGEKEGSRETIKDNLLEDNIKFYELNSFFMPSLLRKDIEFGLIFIDGGHKYPAVAWDLMYSYNHLAEDGFLFIHDYGSRGDVKHAVDYMAERIPDKIHYLPSTSAETIKAKTPCVWRGHK